MKHSLGGETASQLQAIENTIKRWFRSQADAIKAKKRAEAMKKKEAMELQKKLNAAGGSSILMEVSIPEAEAMAAAGDTQGQD